MHLVTNDGLCNQKASDNVKIVFIYPLCMMANSSSITLSFFSKLCGSNLFVKYVGLLSLYVKSINTMQNYPQIIES